MTPPPAASHAAQTGVGIVPHAQARDLAAGGLAQLLEPRAWAKLRLLVDLVVLYLAASAALFAASPIRLVAANRWLAAVFPLLVVGIMQVRQRPDDRLSGSLVETSANVIGVVSLSAMLTIALQAIIGGPHAVGMALRLWVFAAVYLSIARAVLLSVRRQAMRTERFATRTLIVGAGVVGEHLVTRLVKEPKYGLRPVGFLDADPMPGPGGSRSSLPVLGGPDDLAAAVACTGAGHVILAFSSEPDHVLVDKVRECERLGLDVSLVPRLYESINERATLDHVGGLPLLSLHSVNPRGWQFAVKHLLDRSCALLALVVLAPVMVAIALAVRVSSPGPIFFRQRRVGRDGHEFDLLKFRTMRETRDPSQQFDLPDGVAPGGVEGEDRRTPIGQWLRGSSLDELPQFINVLRGDMSLVGPRPERPEYVARFGQQVNRYHDRHRVRSGITGWAQVNGLRGQTSIADRVEWDNHYIQNWSVRLDLRILVLTVAEVLRFRDSQKVLDRGTPSSVSPAPPRI